jgi:hypothetical protein
MLTTLVWDTIMWSLLSLRGNAPYHLRSLLSFLMGREEELTFSCIVANTAYEQGQVHPPNDNL